MAQVPTMMITFREGGHQALINVSDFDPRIHQRIGDPDTTSVVGEDLAALKVHEVVRLVDNANTVLELDALEQAENSGKKRPSVLSAIEKRRAEL